MDIRQQQMKAKLLEQLQTRVKDMGLTAKGVDDLVAVGVKQLTNESTDEDVAKVADSLASFGKIMQGEITRKTRPTQSQQPKSEKKEEQAAEGEISQSQTNSAAATDAIAKLSEQYEKLASQLQKMQAENETLKAEQAATERAAHIQAKAAELGIPNYLVARLSLGDGADVDKELTEFKQELVAHNLVPKEAAQEVGRATDALKDDAKSWAAKLPNR